MNNDEKLEADANKWAEYNTIPDKREGREGETFQMLVSVQEVAFIAGAHYERTEGGAAELLERARVLVEDARSYIPASAFKGSVADNWLADYARFKEEGK